MKNIWPQDKKRFSVLLVGLVFAFTASAIPFVRADQYDSQIRELQNQNANTTSLVEELTAQAKSLEDAINTMQSQINALQAQIDTNVTKSIELKADIAEAEIELAYQKDVLGQNIKAMYIEDDITMLEQLATSSDLSQFVDKQQYRSVVQSKIKSQVDKITRLRLGLQAQKDEVERLIKEDKKLKTEVAAQQAERNRLLNLNQAERNEFNAQIAANNEKINELRHQQYLATVAKYGGGGGQVGGGGYPWGHAPCVHGGHVQGYCYDYEWSPRADRDWHNWETGGYAYRNCTDYVAWKTGASGGLGNAKNWYDRAPMYGYSRGRTPKPGAAAVDIYLSSYGHVMYVEAVDTVTGEVLLSDYNRAGPGEYGVLKLSAAEAAALHYVYF